RKAALRRLVEALRARQDELLRTLALEAGKPLKAARVEIERCLETLTLSAEEATRIAGAVEPINHSPRTRGYDCFVRRVPVGVCSCITPFNFPLNLAAHKIGPAIAAGCPFVLKPAEKTPITSALLAEALRACDLPPGSWSVFLCDVSDVGPLVEDDRAALLSFTGSDRVGWALKAQAGRKKVVLELGGNAACVVDETADVAYAADRVAAGAFSYAGQSCISVQRVYALASVADAFAQALTERAAALVVGDPLDETVDVGPVIDDAAAERLDAWIDEAVDRGARVLTGGRRQGRLVQPTVLFSPPEDASVVRCEVFGPVVSVIAVESFEEALDRVNDSEFGLQAGVFTNRLDRALTAWEQLEVGGVVVNDASTFRADAMPYGGVKRSGLGREGVRSAIEHMTEPRVLVVNRQAGA
ncbi:MAG: aldehyde dehydrogenase family protein, partial [Planctomycetota bacterium]